MNKLVINPNNTTLVNASALLRHDAWDKKGKELAAHSCECAQSWADGQIAAEVSTATLVDSLIAQRMERGCKKSMGQLFAAAVNTPENRRALGVPEITTEHLTGSKGLSLPGKGNARTTYNLVNAIEVARKHRAKLDPTTAHVLLTQDGDKWGEAYLKLAAYLRKNETVNINGSITDAVT